MRIYYCDPMYTRNRELYAIMLLMEHEGLSFTMSRDPDTVIRVTKGKSHPSDGFVGIMNDGSEITSIYQLVDWIGKKGLRRC